MLSTIVAKNTDLIPMLQYTLSECMAPDFLERYPLAGEGILAELEGVLADLWGAIGVLLAASGNGIQTVQDNPGYLCAARDGEAIFMPLHLAFDFPEQAQLMDLTRIGQNIRRTDESVICLSGSAVSGGAGIWSGDLDFCEYVPKPADMLARGIVRACVDPEPLCIRIKINTAKWQRPWKQSQTASELATAGASMEHGKCDFVVDSLSYGVVEATNVILVVDRDNDTRAAKRSFGYQELPIGAKGWLPRKLTDARELARYLAWLRKEAEQQKELNPVKALKRCISLARILWLGDVAEAGLEVLSGRVGQCAALKSRRELGEHLRGVPCPDVLVMAERLVESNNSFAELVSGGEIDPDDMVEIEAMIHKILTSVDAIAERRASH